MNVQGCILPALGAASCGTPGGNLEEVFYPFSQRCIFLRSASFCPQETKLAIERESHSRSTRCTGRLLRWHWLGTSDGQMERISFVNHSL